MADEELQETLMDGMDAVNLDEITTDTVKVAFREENGEWRLVELDVFVPMSVFHKVMSSYKRAQRAKELWDRAEDDNRHDKDPMLSWMMEQVLNIWKVKEPTMTMERLENGLTLRKATALFRRFFNDLRPQNANKALPESNGTESSGTRVVAFDSPQRKRKHGMRGR